MNIGDAMKTIIAVLLVATPALAVDNQLVPCGAGLCVGTTPQDVTLGATVMETRGPLPDGGLAILQTVVPGAGLVLQSQQPTGTSVIPDVIARSRNVHDGGTIFSVRNGNVEVFAVGPGGVAGITGVLDGGPITASAFTTSGTAKLEVVDAGVLNVAGQFSAFGNQLVAGSSGVLVANDFSVTGNNDATFNHNARFNGNITLAGVLTDSATAITLSGGCTSPTVTWSNGTAEAQFDVGGTCTGISTITLVLPTAAHGWTCSCIDTGAAKNVRQSGGTTASAVITNYGTSVATPADWTDGADIRCLCRGG